MRNVQFDAQQFNKMMGIDSGEIVTKVSKSSKSSVRNTTLLVVLGSILIPIIGIFAFGGIGVTSISISLIMSIAYYALMEMVVLKEYRDRHKKILTNKYWRYKLRTYGENYDSELGITTNDLEYDIDEIRQVYFNETTYEAYIPVHSIHRDTLNNTKIKFKEVPKGYHKLEYFKDKLSRAELLELEEVVTKYQPTFDETVVILQSEAEVLNQLPKENKTPKQLGNVLDKNAKLGLETIKLLNKNKEELEGINRNIAQKELPKLYKENSDLISRIND